MRGELLAFHPDGDAAGGINANGGLGGGGVDQLDSAGVVGGRRGVGHAHDRGEPAGGGGLRAGEDVFLVRLAGLAEMDMDIDQAGADHETGRIDLAGLFLLGGGKAADKFAVGNEDIAGGVALGRRIDDAAVLYPEKVHEENAKRQMPKAKLRVENVKSRCGILRWAVFLGLLEFWKFEIYSTGAVTCSGWPPAQR